MRGSLAAALGAFVWALVALPLVDAQDPAIQITVEAPPDPSVNGTTWVGELDVSLIVAGVACPSANIWTLFLEPMATGNKASEATATWTPARLEFEVPAGQYTTQPYQGTQPSVLRVIHAAPGNVTVQTTITATTSATGCVPPAPANAGSTQSMVFTFGPGEESAGTTELAMPAPGGIWAVVAAVAVGVASARRR